MGGTTSEGFDGPAISRSMSWFFTVDDSVDEVVAYYEKEWIGADRDEEKTEDYTEEVIFKGSFDDAQEGEYLAVSISEGELQVTEVLNPGRFPEE